MVSGRKPPEFRPKGLGMNVLRYLNALNALFAHASPRPIGATVEKKSVARGKKLGGETVNGDAPRPLSSSPSPERIDEKVGRESPPVDEHTGSGEIRYSA